MPKPLDKIGPYTLISKLGRGAFGVVWLAEKRTAIATTKVAIKIPNDEDVELETVRQEAALWVHASGHPNVLPIIDADIHDGHVIIVSEYAPDGSLSKWLERHAGKAPSIEAAVEMMHGILAGLEHLHKREIIHRDLKPDNILLQNDTPRLADFGIARILKTTSQSTVSKGTPAYMPPEAFDGRRSEQTDIWSAGVIFYQLLSGRLPFPQADFTGLVGAILTREPEPLPAGIPAGLDEIVKRALEKEPSKRYASAGEMRQALRAASLAQGSGRAAAARTEVLPERVSTEAYPSRRVRKESRSGWMIGGALVLVILSFFIWYAFLPFGTSSQSPINSSVNQNSPAAAPASSASPTVAAATSPTPPPAAPSTGNSIPLELHAKIEANKALDGYSAYRSGDGYYVLLPKTQMSELTVSTDKGISQPSWEQRRDEVVLKFELEAGMNARIQQSYNRLEITFSPSASKQAP